MTNKLEVILTSGLVASGKTTWAKKMVDTGKYNRVNKDDLRKMIHNSIHTKKNEKLVLSIRDKIIIESIESGKSIIVDDTNLNPVHEDSIRKMIADKYGDKIKVDVKFFDVDVEEAILRDAKREKPVGENAIREMYNKYLANGKRSVGYKYVPNKKLPKAFICDIDGTVALMNERSPYDYEKVDTDKPNKVVISMVRDFSKKYKLIFVSGRQGNETCLNKTCKWLSDNVTEYYENIFMRKDGDTRPDEIIKREIFLEEIAPKYNIQFVVDDRDRVCKMWRSLGLVCLQVDEGNF